MIQKTITEPSALLSLVSVYERADRAELLYKLLSERDETTNISHRAMPCLADHLDFIEGRPYEVWDFIIVDGEVVGACYLTRNREIGIFVFREYQGHGYGPQAVKALMSKCGSRKYLANINPKNNRSAEMFAGLGFHLVQHTYEL